jgi:hypothetical protein
MSTVLEHVVSHPPHDQQKFASSDDGHCVVFPRLSCVFSTPPFSRFLPSGCGVKGRILMNNTTKPKRKKEKKKLLLSVCVCVYPLVVFSLVDVHVEGRSFRDITRVPSTTPLEGKERDLMDLYLYILVRRPRVHCGCVRLCPFFFLR